MGDGLIKAETVNRLIKNDAVGFISHCEERYHERICDAVNSFFDKSGYRLVMLAGPSSSGKTTTAKLMSEEIIRRGRPSKIISLDDFYLDQTTTFYFEDGTPDYETHNALDIPYISTCLSSLIKDGECMLPRFNFYTKKREKELMKTNLSDDEVVIVEGLHAINPIVTDTLDERKVTKMYVSVSSRIVDSSDEVLLSKRNIRFIRRLIRDYNFRNSDVDNTFMLWKGVQIGEARYIFPFSHRADRRIDSIHPYEPCLFKEKAIKLLDLIGEDSIYFNDAKQLKEKLSCFESVDSELIADNSLLREFIG
ncbi:MAG: uridine kinase [Acutalibacteraceae bacterium]